MRNEYFIWKPRQALEGSTSELLRGKTTVQPGWKDSSAGEEPLGSLRTKLVNKVGGQGEEAVPVGGRGGGRCQEASSCPTNIYGARTRWWQYRDEQNNTFCPRETCLLSGGGGKSKKNNTFSKQRDKNMHMLEGDKHFGDR